MDRAVQSEKENFMRLLFKATLVENIKIIEITPCLSDPDRIKFLAQADKPLGDILPLLYLYLPNAKYSEKLETLSYTHEQHLITIFSTGKIGMTYVKDREEAKQLIDYVKNLINRASIYHLSHGKPEPKLLELKKKANPMEIRKHLPRTDCKDCGEMSCYAFAIRLLSGEKELSHCPPLQSREYGEKRVHLNRILQPIKL